MRRTLRLPARLLVCAALAGSASVAAACYSWWHRCGKDSAHCDVHIAYRKCHEPDHLGL